MDMIIKIYLVIIAYFVLGAAGFLLINRKRSPEDARKNWIKYLTYFAIINTLFASIVFKPVYFSYIAVIIIVAGLYELYTLYRRYGSDRERLFFAALIIYAVFSTGFYLFSRCHMNDILFGFLVVSVFDSFSQISGQLAGRIKLVPAISPGKTYEGFAGGLFFAAMTAMIIKDLPAMTNLSAAMSGILISLSALAGDLLASLYKRKFGVKDYSNLIPGHGGVLDRFDSLMAGGAAMLLLSFITH
ncbi:MAG: phosphatidate cytidylyltransferase [Bacteroidales bacterium]|jgi:phosphatidate cytidylyltransferase|nr:phosphatidate cytidylyltransferase [Bacteroidales bacterium]